MRLFHFLLLICSLVFVMCKSMKQKEDKPGKDDIDADEIYTLLKQNEKPENYSDDYFDDEYREDGSDYYDYYGDYYAHETLPENHTEKGKKIHPISNRLSS